MDFFTDSQWDSAHGYGMADASHDGLDAVGGLDTADGLSPRDESSLQGTSLHGTSLHSASMHGTSMPGTSLHDDSLHDSHMHDSALQEGALHEGAMHEHVLRDSLASERAQRGLRAHADKHTQPAQHAQHAQHAHDEYAEYAPRQHAEPQAGQHDDQQRYHDLLLSEQFLSPELSLHDTPLLSPHALAPLPASAPRDFAMPPAAVSSASYTPRRRASGKVSKQSPPMRWRSSSLPEDDFRLGDAALDEPVSVATIMNLAPRPQEDLDERLRSAIAATAASSQSSSRRTSSVSSSTRVTPRILPRLSSSADPSPLLAPNNPNTSGSAAVEDDIDQTFLKSNYRNLIDGTHKHLNFPAADRLTSELRAKKTVHKLAEQERRNRMNVAIADLSAAMDSQGDNTASKAATVERATEHIRKLNERIRELERRVQVLEGAKHVSKSP